MEDSQMTFGPNQARRDPDSAAAERVARAAMAGGLALALTAGAGSLAFARPTPDDFSELAKQVTPAVVYIATKGTAEGPMTMGEGDMPMPFGPDSPFRDFMERYFGQQMPEMQPGPEPRQHRGQQVEGVGSGFIIDRDGYVVTNDHVVTNADEIEVRLTDGSSYPAKLLGHDDKTDLALLKIDAKKPLPAVKFGDSDAVEVGDWVMAVGNPFGLGGTVTAGIVSARGRSLPGGALIDFIQIDAAINRGNSGGPTFNIDGEVVGVNAAIYSPNGGSVGIGFAIPSNLAKQVVTQLRENGKIERGWLGVRIQTVTPEMAEGFGLEKTQGALIASVEPNSPAGHSGLKAGDIILTWDGKAVGELVDLPRLVAFTPVDQKVKVELWRDHKKITLSVVTGTAPETGKLASEATPGSGKATAEGFKLGDTGITVADLSEQSRRAFGIGEGQTGVVIIDVAPNSVAAEEGLHRGDLIKSLALEPVTSAREAAAKVESLKTSGQKVVAVMAVHDGVEGFLALRLGNA